MSDANNYNRRRAARLEAESCFRNTSWAYPATNIFSSLMRKRFAAIILDISAGGIGMLTSEQMRIGEYIELTVCYKDFKPFVVNCRVRSCREYDEMDIGGTKLDYFKVGLQLELCSNETMNSIKKVVQLVSIRQPSEAS